MRDQNRRNAIARLLVALLAMLSVCASGGAAEPGGESVAGSPSILEEFGRLPLHFEPNLGQAERSVGFVARGPGYLLSLGTDTVSFQLARDASDPAWEGPAAMDAAITMRFVGGRVAGVLRGELPLPGRSNYFNRGEAAAAITDVPHFGQVRMAQIYPGIDLVFHGNQRDLEYDFVLAPNANPDQVVLQFDGAERVEVDDGGDLVLHTPAGVLRQRQPRLYQEANGARHRVAGGYVLLDEHQVGFWVARYDAGLELVIDPVFVYSTFICGQCGAAGTAIAVDSAGNAYVAGWTYSTKFPTLNAYDSRNGNGDQDTFITKFNSSGTGLIYSTYFGQSKGQDYATGIAIDGQGNAYVTGTTSGTDLPTTAGAYQPAPLTGGGAFAAKFGPLGNTLLYSTYILNAANTRVAVDNSGHAYIAGQAGAGFATTPGAFQTALRTSSGGAPFVLKLNPGGTGVDYSTFVSGTGVDTARAIALDGAGSVYLVGSTTSLDFPLSNPLQASAGGGLEGFVSKLNATGTGLLYSTYLGGTLDDSVNAIAVDQNGIAYLAGETYSSNFPVKNAFQPVKSGSHLVNSSLGNAFITKLSAAGNAIVYSSFLGGEICFPAYCQSVFGVPQIPGDAAYGVAIDAQGHALVTGRASTYTFPLIDTLKPEKTQDNFDSLFVSKVSARGSSLLYSSILYTGFFSSTPTVTGVPDGAGQAIASDGAGSAYLTISAAMDFPVTAGAWRTASVSGDSVVFKLSSGNLSVALTSSINPAAGGSDINLSAAVSAATPQGTVYFLDGNATIGSAPVVNGTATLSRTLPVGIRSLSAIYRDGTSEAESNLLYQVVNPLNVCS